ncbi:MAG TPA: mucoidy inhibitor MuiA family protein [Polyangia bacterium]
MRRCLVAVWLLVPVTVAQAAPPAAARVSATLDRVLVFSDQARVFRSATVALERGPLVASLADLPAAVDPDSIRVECDSAEVQRVEVSRTRDALPRQDEAKALLARLTQVTDGLRALDDEAGLLRAELGLVEALQPAAQRPRPEKEPATIVVETWRRVLAWSEGRAARLRARLTAVGLERYALEQKLHPLRLEARTLQVAVARAPSARVVVTLAGKPGRHRVVLSYLVGQVRWVPSYDLVYDDGRRTVEASYYAVVTQATGEDWKDARLSFSTTMPTALVAVPELPTWTLGRRTDFTPTPRPRPDPPAVAWGPPRSPEVADEVTVALAQGLGGVAEGGEGDATRAAGELAAGPHRVRVEELERRVDEVKKQVARSRVRLSLQQDTVLGGLAGGVRAEAPPPPPAAATAQMEVMTVARRAPGRWFRGNSGRGPSGPPTETVPWTDTGYVAPALDPDLPAAAAKGYRYVMDAPGRHSVASTGVAGRVPLLRQRFAVSPTYKVVPGRSPAAYLTAAVDNSSGRPILRGQANLFVGAMYSGQTQLETALPGTRLTLPLGVDDRLKVNRITTQRTISQGVLFKDDVSEYTVQIEIANHRRHAVQVEVEDQVPLGRGDAKIEGFTAAPAAVGPDEDGKVKFATTVGGSSVLKLGFRYRVVRPKSWELSQHD